MAFPRSERARQDEIRRALADLGPRFGDERRLRYLAALAAAGRGGFGAGPAYEQNVALMRDPRRTPFTQFLAGLNVVGQDIGAGALSAVTSPYRLGRRVFAEPAGGQIESALPPASQEPNIAETTAPGTASSALPLRKALRPLLKRGETGPVTGFESQALQDRPGYYSVGFEGEQPLTGNMFAPKDPFFVPPERQEELAQAHRRRRLFEEALGIQEQQRRADIENRLRERRLGLGETLGPQDAATDLASGLLEAETGGYGGLSASDLVRLRLGEMTDARVRAGIEQRAAMGGQTQALAAERIASSAHNADLNAALDILGMGSLNDVGSVEIELPEEEGGGSLRGLDAFQYILGLLGELRNQGTPLEGFEEGRVRSEAELSDEEIVDQLTGAGF